MTSTWAPYSPSPSQPWNLSRAIHLHCRAEFRATWTELQRDLADGVEASVDRILTGKTRIDGQVEGFERLAEMIGDAAVGSGNAERLKAWWVYQMIFSPDPLAERLTLLWHNHFATSNQKVNDLALMRQQNELFREHGRGSFGALLRAVIKHPAMLIWLDADSNRKEHPNENLARELMELFTLGVGNYTETDVKEAARCLTGWTTIRGEFQVVPKNHDDGEKHILGKSGNFDGDQLLDLLLDHPAISERIAWRLCDLFFGENVATDDDRSALAAGLREHDLNIGWAVETILRSKLLYSEENLRTRIANPAQFVVGAIRALEQLNPPPSTLIIAEQLTRMGQDLFYPPNVFGWPGGREWINTRSLIARGNLGTALAQGELSSPRRPANLAPVLQRHAGSNDPRDWAVFLWQLFVGQSPDEDSLTPLLSTESTDHAEIARRMVANLLVMPALHLC